MNLDTYFHITERRSSLKTECRAGLTTFLAMAYIIAVNPSVLALAGIPVSAAITATCLASGLSSILMGLWANRPLALAPGMGLNAVVATSLTAAAGGDWRSAMAVVFIEGICIYLMVICGFRRAMMDAMPASIRYGLAAGLGLFISFIGLVNGGIVIDDATTLIQFGSPTSPEFIVACISLISTIVCVCLKVPGAFLIGMLLAVVAGIPLGLTQLPQALFSLPDFSSLGAPFIPQSGGTILIFNVFINPVLLTFVFSLFMSDFFDTMGTASAVAGPGHFLDKDGKVKDMNTILKADACAASIGAFAGASSMTVYMESSAGCADGARTGFSSIVVGLLFLFSAFFAPVIGVVCASATAGALIIVGFLMMESVAKINWTDIQEGLPAFMVTIGIPFTYSISTGLGLGFVSYIVVMCAFGKADKIPLLMWIASLAFIIAFLIGA